MTKDLPQSLNEMSFQAPSNRTSNVRPPENYHEIPSFNSLRSLTKQIRERTSYDKPPPPVQNLKCGKRYYNKFKNIQKIVYTILEDPTSFIVARIFFYIVFLAILFTSIDSIVWTTL